MLSKNVVHEYDPHVFHNHSSDLPHLNDWITELIALTENSLPQRTHPTTEQIVGGIQRYDVVIKELVRHIRIFSTPLAKLTAKVWSGVLKLLNYMIKSYHRYVKHTSHLQSQAERLLKERQSQVVAAKMKEEEAELERTVLKAKIRNLEAELESVRVDQKQLDNENSRLRSIVSAYIMSEGMNEGVWEVMKSDNEIMNPSDSNGDDTGEAFNSIDFRRKAAVDAGKLQLRKLNQLDIEMNQVLGNILKEEDRQRLVVTDLMSLMKRNQDIFGHGATVKGGGWRAGPREAIPVMTETGTQVDERDSYGVVDDLIPSPRMDYDVMPPQPPPHAKLEGLDVPFNLRKLMKSFPSVLRIPPAAWVCQTILAIYLDKIRVDDERAQVGLRSVPLAEHIYSYYTKMVGLESMADNQIAQMLKAVEHHMGTVSRVSLFASQLGIYEKDSPPSLDGRDTDFILDIIRSLMRQGELKKKMTLAAKFKEQREKRRSSVAKPVESEAADLTIGSDILRSAALKTVQETFEKWFPDGGHEYLIKVKVMRESPKGHRFVELDDLIEMMMEPWHQVRLSWEDHARHFFTEFCTVHKVLVEAQFATDMGTKDRDAILMHVHKNASEGCTRRSVRFFQRQIKDNSALILANAKRDKKAKISEVEKEPVCETMSKVEFGQVVRVIKPAVTEKEIEVMFSDACEWSHATVLRTLEQMWIRCASSTAEGLDAQQDELAKMPPRKKVAIVSSPVKSKAVEVTPKRVAKSTKAGLLGPSDQQQGGKSGYAAFLNPSIGGGDGSSVDPTLSTSAVDEFEDPYEKRDHFYMHTKSQKTQWVKPYHQRTFHMKDIELDAFIYIIIRYNLFAQSPLLEMLYLSPKDLWPNADVMLKQLAKKHQVLLRSVENAAIATAALAAQNPQGLLEATAAADEPLGTKKSKAAKAKGKSKKKKDKSSKLKQGQGEKGPLGKSVKSSLAGGQNKEGDGEDNDDEDDQQRDDAEDDGDDEDDDDDDEEEGRDDKSEDGSDVSAVTKMKTNLVDLIV